MNRRCGRVDELVARTPAYHEPAWCAASAAQLVQSQHEDGVAGFIRESIEYVMREVLLLRDNYFWRVYCTVTTHRSVVLEYLKLHNFVALKQGMVDCINPNTCIITEFLQLTRENWIKLVLLDHMDWMSSYYPEALVEE
ncbi:MAG: DUF3419 family protein [Gammaproteobacteria bacterium]